MARSCDYNQMHEGPVQHEMVAVHGWRQTDSREDIWQGERHRQGG